MMASYHFMKGKYLSYASPKTLNKGRLAMFLMWPFDKGLRQTTKRFLGALLRNPFRLFQRSYIQSIMFIQPVDCMVDGGQSMCDGCPDITVHRVPVFSVHEGVTSCRFVRLYLEVAADEDPSIELDTEDIEALDLLEELAADPSPHHEAVPTQRRDESPYHQAPPTYLCT